MHDIKSIRDNPNAFDAALTRRGLAPLSSSILAIDERRRAAILASEQAQARRNAASKEIGEAKKAKDDARAAALMEEVAKLKTTMPELEAAAKAADEELAKELAAIPNLPLDEVPDGVDEHGNVQRHVFGNRRNYAFTPKPHDDLGGALGYHGFRNRRQTFRRALRRAEERTGAARTRDRAVHARPSHQRARLCRDQSAAIGAQRGDVRHGAVAEIRRRSVLGRMQEASVLAALSGGRALMKLSALGLIPTAEVPLTNLVRESIVDEKQLPMRLTALTPCFRAEAGAAGRDTRGMIRQHQFIKVELVSITTPETSKDEHERMLACAEEVLRQLDLHYRVMTLCAGDMGFSAQKTYDIEVWMPGQGEGGAYREISSCSVCGDFQARRMDARYRASDGKPRFVHTLNGSGTAVGRALIAVMETYQQQDGSIAVPDVLQPYMGGLKVIEGEK